MKSSAQNAILAVALVALSNTAVAGGDPDEIEGVEVDISQVDLRSDSERAADARAILAAEEALKAKAMEAELAAEAKAAAKAAKAEEAQMAKDEAIKKGKKVFGSIVDAVSPEGEVPALNNDRFSMYLSDKVLFAQRERKTKRFNIDRARSHLGLLISEERDTVLQGGLAIDTSFTKSFRLSFGTRGYAALLESENEDILAAAIGAETAYKLPFKKLPLEFGASMYYAPDILTFGAGDRAFDTQLDVTLPVRSQLSVFGGVRYLSFDTRPDDREVDNQTHLGLRWDFK